MKLSILERITLLGILPAEGDVVTIRVLTKLKRDLGFTEQEIKDFNIQSADGKISWQNGAEVEIEIGERATDIIKDALKKLNDEKRLREETLPVYDKFYQ